MRSLSTSCRRSLREKKKSRWLITLALFNFHYALITIIISIFIHAHSAGDFLALKEKINSYWILDLVCALFISRTTRPLFVWVAKTIWKIVKTGPPERDTSAFRVKASDTGRLHRAESAITISTLIQCSLFAQWCAIALKLCSEKKKKEMTKHIFTFYVRWLAVCVCVLRTDQTIRIAPIRVSFYTHQISAA